MTLEAVRHRSCTYFSVGPGATVVLALTECGEPAVRAFVVRDAGVLGTRFHFRCEAHAVLPPEDWREISMAEADVAEVILT